MAVARGDDEEEDILGVGKGVWSGKICARCIEERADSANLFSQLDEFNP
jgi:hypothetical protein